MLIFLWGKEESGGAMAEDGSSVFEYWKEMFENSFHERKKIEMGYMKNFMHAINCAPKLITQIVKCFAYAYRRGSTNVQITELWPIGSVYVKVEAKYNRDFYSPSRPNDFRYDPYPINEPGKHPPVAIYMTIGLPRMLWQHFSGNEKRDSRNWAITKTQEHFFTAFEEAVKRFGLGEIVTEKGYEPGIRTIHKIRGTAYDIREPPSSDGYIELIIYTEMVPRIKRDK